MPTPNRTTNDEIVAAARSLLDEGGLDALTMQAVATRVGVRAPSLYKRVQSREQLVGLVVESSVLELAETLDVAAEVTADDPVDSLVALARALRAFAHRHPNRFGLVFASPSPAARPSADALAASSAAVLRVSERLAGADDALEAARTVTAWALGFLTMELSGSFQLGGDPAKAFDYGAMAIARAIDAASDFSRMRPST
ncbi:TetR/AcrR family transcriptional regulator [Humibacter sp. RRB41]|uniref:TetR/AcrR family transcriptional regulator n=1 Tax=Humibacter sp. RRB41 TaxID=2919946 RepID=UPI001FAA13BC|nr:TetR/AcrR family transcriptional regulator [Humibacter sp. RRB41]